MTYQRSLGTPAPNTYAPLRTFDVKTYGAVGDGTTNDSAAIQAACDAATSAGGVIFFPAGRYKCLTGITITNKAALRFVGGAGRHEPEPNTPGVVNTGGAVLVAGTSGMTLMTLQSTTAPSAHSGPEFHNVHFEDFTVGQLRNALTAASITSGTVATFTTSAAHGFIVGDSVLVSGVTPSGYNGIWTVATVPTSTTFTADVGTSPSAGTVFGKAALEILRPVPTSTLLYLKGATRYLLDSCTLYGGLVGLKLDPTASLDVSWGRVRHCSFMLNGTGVLAVGAGGAQSFTIDGGDFSVASGQIGVDINGPATMFSVIGDPKFDIGQNTNTTGASAIGVRIKAANNFKVDATFEMNGGTGIQVGAGGLSFGSIRSRFQGNGSPRPGIGIDLNGTDTAGGAVQNVTMAGCTFTGLNKAIHFGANTKACTVLGGGVYQGDNGIVADASSARHVWLGFVHSDSNTPYTHITDNGTSNAHQWCHDFTTLDLPSVPAVKQAALTQSTVSNTTTETALATYTIPAGTVKAGTVYRVTLSGTTDNIATSGTLILRMRLGGVSGSALFAGTLTSQTGAATNKTWRFVGELTFRVGGSNATVAGDGQYQANWAATGSAAAQNGSVPGGTFDTTTAKDLVFTAQFATADPSNIIRADQAIFELVNP